MMGMNGMRGGQGGGGHATTCPLCRGTGRVPAQVAAQVAVPEANAGPIEALSAAMMSAPKGRGGGGGHGGHGGM